LAKRCLPTIDAHAPEFDFEQTKTARFAGRFFRLRIQIAYSVPLPKRRDHHPARRGWVSLVASEAGSAGAGAGGGDASGWL
jgi:hypothetical protein